MGSLATGSTIILLRNYVVEQCLMNVSVDFVQNIVYRSPTEPLVSSDLPYYIFVELPKWLFRDYHKLLYDKPRIWEPIPMAKFLCENQCCSVITIPLRVCKCITIHKLQGVSIGIGNYWDTAVVTITPKNINNWLGMELVNFYRNTPN